MATDNKRPGVGRGGGVGVGGVEALREHSGHDGLHTPISPMKSLPQEKEEKGGGWETVGGGGSVSVEVQPVRITPKKTRCPPPPCQTAAWRPHTSGLAAKGWNLDGS